MSIKIIDWVEWSDPIIKEENYCILQMKHWQRSDIPPKNHQLRLILASYDLQIRQFKPYYILYTPALSSLNGLYEFPHEINDCWVVECQLNQIACRVKEFYSDLRFWYEAKVNNIFKLIDFDKSVKLEQCNLQSYPDYLDLQDFTYQFRPQLFQYACWLWVLFDDQGYAGLDMLFKCSDSNLTLIYFSEWIDKETKSIITNCNLGEEDMNLVNDWRNKGLVHNFPEK